MSSKSIKFLALTLLVVSIAATAQTAKPAAAAPAPAVAEVKIPADSFKELNYYILQAENLDLKAKQTHADIDKQVAQQMQQIQAQANPIIEKLRKDLKVPANFVLDQTKQAFVPPPPAPTHN